MANTSVFILAPDFPHEGDDMLSGPYAQSLAKAQELGYDGVEIIMGNPEQFDVRAFQALLREHDLRVSAVNCGGIHYKFKSALVSADPQQRERALEILKGDIWIAAQLKCLQQIGVARGGAVPGKPMRWFKGLLVEVLQEAADYAAQHQVSIAFEYTNRFEISTINTGAEAREIVDRASRPNLGILVDTAHSFLEDPDVCQNILDLGPRVKYFHLHDSNGGAAIIGGGRERFRGHHEGMQPDRLSRLVCRRAAAFDLSCGRSAALHLHTAETVPAVQRLSRQTVRAPGPG